MRKQLSSHKMLDRQFHVETAISYDSSVGKQYRIYSRYSPIKWIRNLKRLEVKGPVLDIGCGTGSISLPVASSGFRVVAIDHSLEMINIARQKADLTGVNSKINFVVADADALPFRHDTFGALLAAGVLHHLERIEPTISEIARVLRHGQPVFITEPCCETVKLSKWINNMMTILVNLVRHLRYRSVVQKHEVPTVDVVESEHSEGPISGKELLTLARKHGIRTTEMHYLIHFNYIHRLLPDSFRTLLTLLVSFPFRRRGGDILFFYGCKEKET